MNGEESTRVRRIADESVQSVIWRVEGARIQRWGLFDR